MPRLLPTSVLVAVLLVLGACDSRGLSGTGDASTENNSEAGSAYGEQVIRACMVATGCSPLPVPHGFLQHPDLCAFDFATYQWLTFVNREHDAEVIARLLACAAKHGGDDCAGFHACYGGNWTTMEICRSEATCHGTRIVHTSDPTLYFDCASLGSSCVVQIPEDRRACCARKTCTTGCDSSTTGTRCHGGGVSTTFDCSVVGLVCIHDGFSGCGGDGEVCTGSTCLSPTVIRYCPGIRQATCDCSQNPFFSVCPEELYMATLPCDPAGQECNPLLPGPPEKKPCHGDKLGLCINGYKREVDCTAFGFKGCHDVDGWGRCHD